MYVVHYTLFHRPYRLPVTLVMLRQTNQPSMTEGLEPLSSYYIMLIRTKQALSLARVLRTLFIFKYSFKIYGMHAALRDFRVLPSKKYDVSKGPSGQFLRGLFFVIRGPY